MRRHLASNVCCRKENSFQDRHCIRHHASANNSNSTMSDNAQKLKQGNIFWKIPMKIPVNRHYYSLVTENVDSMCPTKTAGRGGGVYVLVVLGGTTLQNKQGESLHPGLSGDRRPWPYLREGSSNPLHVWFYVGVFGVGESNGTNSGLNKCNRYVGDNNARGVIRLVTI